MAFDGSGNFAPPSAPTFPAVAGTTISSSYFNTIIQELCNNGLSLVLPRDGQAPMTGDLDMGTNQLVNVGDPASAQHAVTKAYLEANALGKFSGIYSPVSDVVTSHGLIQFNSIVTNILAGLGYWKADANGPTLDFMKSRGATVNAQTIVQNNDVLGGMRFYGSDGAGLLQAGAFYAAVDGTPGTNDMPTRFVWSLAADGASSPSEVMRLSSAGLLTLPGALTVSGLFTLDDSATISGTLGVEGLFTLNDNFTLNGNAAISGTLTTEGLFTLNDNADINGAVDISGALTVHGLLTDDTGLEYGWKLIPVVAATGAVTLGASHAAKGSSNTTGGWAIPANGTWAAPVGTAITLHNDSGSAQSVTITTDTLRLAGSTATGTRTIAARGVATLWKTKSTEWMLMGAGVS